MLQDSLSGLRVKQRVWLNWGPNWADPLESRIHVRSSGPRICLPNRTARINFPSKDAKRVPTEAGFSGFAAPRGELACANRCHREPSDRCRADSIFVDRLRHCQGAWRALLVAVARRAARAHG